MPTVLQAGIFRRAMVQGKARRGGLRDLGAQSVRDLWNSLLDPQEGGEKEE